MIIEMFCFTNCEFYRFKTDIPQPCTILPEEHKLILPLAPESQYSISIDSSTKSTGIVISELKSKFPVYFINAVRDDDVEFDYLDYTNNLTIMLHSLFSRTTSNGSRAFKYCEIESPFYNPKRGIKSYQVLKSQFDRVVKIASKGYQIIVFTTPPQGWKSWYLAPVKAEWGLNMTKSNKDAIKRYGLNFLQSFSHINNNITLGAKFNDAMFCKFKFTDIWDALGIDRFFFGTKYVEDEETGQCIINVGQEMSKSKKFVYYTTFFYDDKNPEEVESNIELLAKSYAGILDKNNIDSSSIAKHRFIFCNELSIEDNIRVMAEQISVGIYYAVANLTIAMLPELYRGNMLVDGKPTKKIRPKTQILIVGYREV